MFIKKEQHVDLTLYFKIGISKHLFVSHSNETVEIIEMKNTTRRRTKIYFFNSQLAKYFLFVKSFIMYLLVAAVDDHIHAGNHHNLVLYSIPFRWEDIDSLDNPSLVEFRRNRSDSMHLVACSVADSLEAGI